MIEDFNNNTKDIYNKNASLWSRLKPNSLSDFTGRPTVFELCGSVEGLKILDLGCGEGYGARLLIKKGASNVEGIDISSQMINLAMKYEENKKSKINYQVGNIKSLPFEDNTFDIVLGIFVFNYLYIDETLVAMKEIYRVLKKQGRFIFVVPHPSFPQIKKEYNNPFFFDFKNKGYFSSRDLKFEGSISCRDGKKLPVQMVHKLTEDYFDCLSKSGFIYLPKLRELGVKEDHLELDREFFINVNDIPLHLAISVEK